MKESKMRIGVVIMVLMASLTAYGVEPLIGVQFLFDLSEKLSANEA